MEKEGPLSDCGSDSSGLPELELNPNHTFEVAKLLKDDVAWAEYKGLHWPALVRDVDKKNKKVKVWYLDSPGKCFKVPFKKIHDFFDDDFTKKVQDDATSHPLGKKHAEVYRRAHIFAFQKFRGTVYDPLKFFDPSQPYFFNARISEIKFDSVNVSTENVADKNDNSKENSEAESLVESDVESSTTTKCLAELNEEEDCPYDDEMVDKILSYIMSGNVDNYLIDIVNSKISNKRHELYVEALEKGQVQLFVESQESIPIKNQDLHNVSIYLHSLYKRKIEKGKPKMNEYIVSVWLPEAVNKAISLIEIESMKLPDDSCGKNKSNSLLEAEASDLTVDSGSNKFSSSPILAESSELPFDNGKISVSPTEVEVSELLVDSSSNNTSSSTFQVKSSETPVDTSSSNGLGAPKRKLDSFCPLDENYNSNEREIEACVPSKKKFTGRKKQKRSFKTLKPGKKTPQKMDKPRKDNLVESVSEIEA